MNWLPKLIGWKLETGVQPYMMSTSVMKLWEFLMNVVTNVKFSSEEVYGGILEWFIVLIILNVYSYVGSYEDVDVCAEYEAGFFCMCGFICTISDEKVSDTHTLSYKNP